MKQQQQGISVPHPDNRITDKPLITENCNNQMELKKVKRGKYFTRDILELGAQRFSEGEVRICASITAEVDKIILRHK